MGARRNASQMDAPGWCLPVCFGNVQMVHPLVRGPLPLRLKISRVEAKANFAILAAQRAGRDSVPLSEVEAMFRMLRAITSQEVQA